MVGQFWLLFMIDQFWLSISASLLFVCCLCLIISSFVFLLHLCLVNIVGLLL